MANESRRELVIANRVAVLQASGFFRGVTDEEPFEYLRPDPPWCWLFDGDEVQDNQKITTKTECELVLHVHQTFIYKPGDPVRDLYKLGRVLLADMQELWMADVRCGGAAWLTLEHKNSIGRPANCDKPVGILATEWMVRYHRNYQNPRMA